MHQRLHAIVHGSVQGVGYRAFALRQAQRLGLKGYAVNRPDGTVEVEAEGEDASLKVFLDALRQGPPYSHVSRVDTEWTPASGSFSRFSVG